MRFSKKAVTAPTPEPQLADRLRKVHVGIRQDLEVTRHLFRGKTVYVICDPMTLENHQLEPTDYTVFVAINREQSLGDIFADLVERGVTTSEKEEGFYRFILTLHRMNFLNLPISDGKLLYERYLARKHARKKEMLIGFLFLRIPLINPDLFLNKTISTVKFLFSRWFFAIWLLLISAAGFVAFCHFDELIEPIQGILVIGNLPLMWLTLIGIKILHELGHAYACKYFGGHVPEMGIYLIAFTPIAYMDATASWGFTRKRERIIVCLAGMYVESMVAAIALFIWCVGSPGLIHDLAYNIIFLASVLTILFNINPLMRYDGYYILSDLLEIPNLRQRSIRYIKSVLKRLILGVQNDNGSIPLRQRNIFLSFGIATTIYRCVIMLAIAALVAYKMFIVGLVIAATFLGGIIINNLKRFIQYLWHDEETAPVRIRAIVVGLVILIGTPAVLLYIPIRSTITAPGELGTTQESVVRARVDGYIKNVTVQIGQNVESDHVLMELTNDACHEDIAQASAELELSNIRQDAYRVEDPGKAAQEKERAGFYRKELKKRQAELADLMVLSETPGRIIDCLRTSDIGLFVRQGQLLATIASGSWQVRTIMTEEEVTDAQPAVGDSVEVRTSAKPGQVLSGQVTQILPAGSRNINSDSMTQVGGGDIAVDPQTGQAGQPYFQVVIDLPGYNNACLYHAMTCKVQFRSASHSIGITIFRVLRRFTNSLLEG
ncbi:MAG: efflux RND transporter periplasmic adaptor subunit [Planctomycetota bacterium]